ncbi:MAG: MerR family transcriptional regulator, partial [Desulfovibrionaceae bacterium]
MHTIGRLARQFGLSRSTLLYYDRIGLLHPTGHAKGEYRRYSAADAARLARICSLREAGLPLERIARVLDGPETALGQALEARLDELVAEMRALREQQHVILELLGSGRLASGAAGEGLLDKATWTALLRDAGFSEEDMRRWHADFERRAPESHLRFLRLLCLPKDEIDLIRAWAASPLRIEHLRKASQNHMEQLFRFFEGLERKGPGGEAETLAALDLARAAAPELLGPGRTPDILDLGCGAGPQSRIL